MNTSTSTSTSTSTTRTRNALIEQMMQRASGAPARSGNRIDLLLDCTDNFPAWEAALLSARELICIEMYIFAPDAFGTRLRQILLDKLAEGVKVALVYDWIGSLNAHLRGFFKPLTEAGAEVRSYNPLGWVSGIGILSRNHRKSFVIDGHTAFVSGLCISAAWKGKPEKGIEAWRDTGLKLEGPIVHDILAAFEDTLVSQGGQMPLSMPSENHIPPAGNARARLLATTPANINTMRLDLNVIGLATQNLWITDAYFMPTRMYVQALINAAKAGVDVRILVPRTSDIKWIGTVSRTQYRQLLEAGVRVFEWNGTMIHAKSAIIDGQWARVGSTNLNLSSWYGNRELDVSIEDADTVHRLEHVFLDDLNHATEVILNEKAHAELKEHRQRMFGGIKRLHKGQAKSVMRQALQLSHALDTTMSGTRLVDESEAWSYLTIGIAILLLAVLIWFVPQVITWPLMLVLLIGGGGTFVHAVKQLAEFKRGRHK
ncbi:phosphatidylserine/phosphatidylglycerophosphate/cardiolipin synthase family protein [Uruburuella testudinis]|uniref:Phosphatidylserine/phosphatidylglycerophosphate/ cardiolipin synthase family protein n=1 Tax=Uruburuella testudinis TaxID=1282863 RepID=A0ABY4DRN0_9NEIS|nr:phosphatidylserine/phosphatidylglycerophosphate/cardiolipin synthase family protein [Uruburuella testudinis]UOO81551.1 phosphatidylserine/phosphatidylglycerophosphate/cardiolipin synthase family protein [Uruburuella testudinis]